MRKPKKGVQLYLPKNSVPITFFYLFSKACSRFSKSDWVGVSLLEADLFCLALHSTEEASEMLGIWFIFRFKPSNAFSIVERRRFILSLKSRNPKPITHAPTNTRIANVVELKVGEIFFFASKSGLYSISRF